MNPIIQHLILQKVRAYVKARKEGKVKKFNFMKTFEKFLRGGAMATLATIIALLTEQDPKIVVPLLTGLGEALYNVVKFFATNKK
jgi:hypothetical protein